MNNILEGFTILTVLCLMLAFAGFVVGSLIAQTTKTLIIIIIIVAVLTLSYCVGKFFNKI